MLSASLPPDRYSTTRLRVDAACWASASSDDYVQFGFTVGAGFSVSLDDLIIATRSSNTGPGTLQLTAIHGAGRFDTEWLSGPDPVWTSKPR